MGIEMSEGSGLWTLCERKCHDTAKKADNKDIVIRLKDKYEA